MAIESDTVSIVENKDRTFKITRTVVENVSAADFIKVYEGIEGALKAKTEEASSILENAKKAKEVKEKEVEFLNKRLENFKGHALKARSWAKTDERLPEKVKEEKAKQE